MMLRWATIAGLIAFVAAQSPARGESLVTEFQDLCLSTRGDEQAADSRAQKAGWIQLSDQELKQASTDRAIHTSGFRHATANNYYTLQLGHNDSLGKLQAKFCAIASTHPPEGSLSDQLAALLGLPAVSFNGRPAFIWRYLDGKYVGLEPTQPEFSSFVRQGGVYALSYGQDSIQSHITLTIIGQ
jgi:hypothetical protein